MIDEIRPNEIREIGILLNGGKSYGWRDNLAELTGVSAYTVRSWVDAEDSAAHRMCSGAAARLIRILVDLHDHGVNLPSYLASIVDKA